MRFFFQIIYHSDYETTFFSAINRDDEKIIAKYTWIEVIKRNWICKRYERIMKCRIYFRLNIALWINDFFEF